MSERSGSALFFRNSFESNMQEDTRTLVLRAKFGDHCFWSCRRRYSKFSAMASDVATSWRHPNA